MRVRAAIALVAAFLSSAASEAQRKGGPPGKPEAPASGQIVPVEHAVLLDGKPFPPRKPPALAAPPARRIFYAAPGASGGDGSEKLPWGDLQDALRKLGPGDRLVLQKGTWAGEFQVDGSCQDGTSEAPIELFGAQAVLRVAGTGAGLDIARKHWWIEDLRLESSAAGEPLVVIEKGADRVTLNRVTLRSGPRPGLEIRGASHFVAVRVTVLGGGQGLQTEPAAGVIVGSGSSDVRLLGLSVAATGGPGVRIGGSEGEPPANVSLSSSTVHNALGPAVRVLSGTNIGVEACDLLQTAEGRLGSGEGLRIEGGAGVTVRSSRISDFALAVRIGVRAAGEKAGAFPEAVVIERTLLASRTGRGAGVVVEGGREVRISNNLLSGLEEAFVVFGAPPATEKLTIANNLALRIARLAFRLEKPEAAALFDYNVFSPARADLSVEEGSSTLSLPAFLRKRMKHSAQVAVTLDQQDLGRPIGVATVDRGTPIPGVTYQGKAPDIGLAER